MFWILRKKCKKRKKGLKDQVAFLSDGNWRLDWHLQGTTGARLTQHAQTNPDLLK